MQRAPWVLILWRAELVRGALQTYFILRHGETDHNAAGIIQGSSDSSQLTALGISQAQAAGAAMAALDVSIDRVFVSPLRRARQTLETLTRAAEPALVLPTAQVVPALREVDLHSWEGQQKAKLKAEDPEMYAAWKAAPLDFAVDGQLPVVDLWDRCGAAWEEIRKGSNHGGTTLLVCHNACGQALLSTALGLDCTHFREHEFQNCGLLELEWELRAKHAARWRWRLPVQSEWHKRPIEPVA